MIRLRIKLFVVLLSLVLLISATSVTAFATPYVNGGTKGNDGPSASYVSGKYYEYLLKVTLTGDNPTDVLAVALSQLGYQEGNSLDNLSGMNSGTGNYTEYNYNFGDFGSGYSYYWCAAFVSFCIYQANCHNLSKLTDWCRNHSGDPNYIWKELSCEKWREALCASDYFRTAAAYKSTKGFNSYYDPTYIPASGDLIFFKKSGNYTSGHIGVVLYATGDTVYTVEGNTSSASGLESNGGGVYAKSYSLDSAYILGYGDMPYTTRDDVVKIDYSGENPTTGLYMSTTNKYVFVNAAHAGDESYSNYNYLLPKFTMFKVTEVISAHVLKLEAEIGGQTVTGYVRNNSDRIIQLSHSVYEQNAETETNIPTDTETVAESMSANETVTESITESVSEAVTEAETITESHTDTEGYTETEAITESYTESDSESEGYTESDSESEGITESRSETATNSELTPESESHTEPASETEAETATESTGETEAETATEKESEMRSETESNTETETALESDTPTDTDTSPILPEQSEPQSSVDEETESKTDQNTPASNGNSSHNNNTDSNARSGCGSSIGGSAVMLMCICCVAGCIFSGKKRI